MRIRDTSYKQLSYNIIKAPIRIKMNLPICGELGWRKLSISMM